MVLSLSCLFPSLLLSALAEFLAVGRVVLISGLAYVQDYDLDLLVAAAAERNISVMVMK